MRGRFNRSHGSAVSFFAFQDVITGTTGFLIIITIFLALNLDEVIGGASTTPDPNAGLATTLQQTLRQIVLLKEKASLAVPAPNETEETLRRLITELKNSIDRLTPAAATPSTRPAGESELEHEIRIEKEKLLTLLEALKKLLPDTTKDAANAESKLAALESQVKEAQTRLQQSYAEKNVLRLIPEKSASNKDPVLVTISSTGFRIQAFDGSPARGASSSQALLQTLQSAYPASGCYIVLYFKPSAVLQFNEITRRVRSSGYEIGYDLIPEHIEIRPANPSPPPKP